MRYLVTLLAIFITNNVFGQDIERAVVKIFVTKQEYDFAQPWQRLSAVKLSGSGCVIDSSHILTCAHVVEFGEYIQVRKAKDSRKYTATVTYIAPEYDLAILEVDDKRFFNNVTPLQLSNLPHIGDKVITYGFPTGGEDLSVTSGIVSRIENTDYSYSAYNNLAIQIDAAINPGNSGGPVLKDNMLIGLAFQGRSEDQGIGYVVPAPVIKTFLKDISDGRYDGPVPVLVKWQDMDNTALRKCYALNDTVSGVLINNVHPCSALYGVLEEGDVLLTIDGIQIENDGTIMLDSNLKTSFETLVQQKNMYDTVQLTVLRDGTIIKIQKQLLYGNSPVLLVSKIDLNPKYFIEGGFVFTTASYYHFKNDDYWAYHYPLLSYYYYGEVLNNDSVQQIVLLSSVLPDISNVGYHDVNNRIVEKVNGRRIRNFQDLVDAFDEKADNYVIEDQNAGKYIISSDNLAATNQRILQKFGIPSRMRL
ncbi:MAG TPA: trypsin-like peptidase domain-containing protein [Flavipsychrobacter sp.]|nr:trypsin-like peptidase domain-containing protein [Flavipsychrobacter sp.]